MLDPKGQAIFGVAKMVMQVFVIDLDGKTSCVTITKDMSVASLKSAVQGKTGVPAEHQRLIWAGKNLTEDDMTLYGYGIGPEATIRLLLRILGGGNWMSAGVNQIRQSATNEIYQSASSSCTANCSQIQSGNVIYLDGSRVGNITFDQQCTANAGCMMENAVDTVMQLIQDLKQGNTTEAGLFPNFGSINLNVSEQEIRNQVTQILETTCTANIEQSQTDNMVYARNSVTGDIGFKQGGNAAANCLMTNAASAKLNLQQRGDQNNTVSGGGFGAIIGLAIAIAIVMVIIRAVNKGKKELDGGDCRDGKTPDGKPCQTGQQGGGGSRSALSMFGGGGTAMKK